MSARHTTAILAAAMALVLTGCSSSVAGDKSDTAPSASPSASEAPKVSDARITSSVRKGAQNVKINRSLRLDVTDGSLRRVTVTSTEGPVKGKMSPDRLSWRSTARFQPGVSYNVRGVAVDATGLRSVYKGTFTTEPLTLDQQTYPSFFPTDGATVGVGMPVIIRFDVAVSDRASIQKHLEVTSEPAQDGAFHWISGNEVHWRPKTYWKPGTTVTVDADIDSVPAGDGIYGQMSRSMTFDVDRSMVSKVDMNTHQMRVYRNGKLIRTIPITTGEQPKYTTRSGVKVIVEKFRHKRMNSETIGIDPESADGYDLEDVEYAMRVTYSGEFVHAAPWSVGSQGHANVSHGCTGMSTSNAGWYYNQSIVGDVIEYTGTDKGMTLTNGFGDWNLPFSEYRAGSAL